jgi:hypothetical protein
VTYAITAVPKSVLLAASKSMSISFSVSVRPLTSWIFLMVAATSLRKSVLARCC